MSRFALGMVVLVSATLCSSCGSWDRSQRITIRGTPLAKYNACREIHRDSPEDIEKLCKPHLNES